MALMRLKMKIPSVEISKMKMDYVCFVSMNCKNGSELIGEIDLTD
jgi:hypothetical protein